MILVLDIDFTHRKINTESGWRYFDEVVLMQYTGSNDNSGKEIYEGDILRLIDFNRGLKPDGTKVWDTITPIFWSEDDLGWSFNQEGWDTRRLKADKLIIGNIYENPELLK